VTVTTATATATITVTNSNHNNTMSATTTTPQEKAQAPPNVKDQKVVDKQQILKKLAKQLIYYFSDKNLPKDVYLQTIMKLNSGHVPISILANFSNVNKIVAGSGILLLNDGDGIIDLSADVGADANTNTGISSASGDASGDGDHEISKASAAATSTSTNEEGKEQHNEEDIMSQNALSPWNKYTIQLHQLLRLAAQQSDLLSFATLNQNGVVVAPGDGESGTDTTSTTFATSNSANGSDDENEGEGQTSSSSPKSPKKDSRIRTFDAIGPSSKFDGTVSDDGSLDNEVVVQSISQDADNHTNVNPYVNTEEKPTNIVILRDVHQDAKEEDIRKVFEQNQILSVQQEIGNCWFVTLDNENNTGDILTTMLNLRSKTICNEAIKARLKTQTMSSLIQSSNISKATRNINKISYRQHYSGSSSQPYYRNSDGVRNKTSSSSTSSSSPRGYYNNYSNQVYAGDRVMYPKDVKKFVRGGNTNTSNPYNGKQQQQQHQYQHSQRDGKSHHHNSENSGNKLKKVEKSLPPPPVVEEHYPSLAGGEVGVESRGAGGDSSPTSITKLEDQQQQPSKTVTLSSKVSSSSGGGYAAALLKDAPPLPPTSSTFAPKSSTTTTPKAVTNLPNPPKALKKNETRASFSSGKATMISLTTDDSSSDDKSSLSSKPESENFTGGTTVATPCASVWGGGRSFADVLKK
jgi:hypothetical protein